MREHELSGKKREYELLLRTDLKISFCVSERIVRGEEIYILDFARPSPSSSIKTKESMCVCV